MNTSATSVSEFPSAVTQLQTNAMTCPLGTDTPFPAFSWKLETSRPLAAQTAWQVLVSPNRDLSSPVWDSGLVREPASSSVHYAGKPLRPQTRYYWQVSILDEQGNLHTSEPSWFETGLMGNDESVWNGAQWIGAPYRTTNVFALTDYQMTVDFQTEAGSCAGIVLAARNKDNFVLFEIDTDRRVLRVLEFCDNAWDGNYQDGNLPTCTTLGDPDGYPISEAAIAPGREHKWNRISILVEGRTVTVTINGQSVIDAIPDLMPASIPFVPRRSCLSMIGFRQLNSRAEYDNLILSNPKTGDIYQEETFSDAAGALSILGTVDHSRLIVENQFELASPVPAVNLLRGFSAGHEIVQARLYAAARGFYEVWINGQRADEAFYHPGFTDYRRRIAYQTFDVTQLLHCGDNTLLATVTKGYYSGYCGYSGPMKYGEQNSFLAKLVLTFDDGSTQTIVTDDSWLFTDRGPVQESDYLDGETADARLDWDTGSLAAAAFGASAKASSTQFSDKPSDIDSAAVSCWKSCGILPWPKAPVPTNGAFSELVPFELSAQDGPAAGIERVLTPISMTENPAGHYVYDFGQNLVGTIRLRVRGARGLSLKLRYGEMSYANGEIYIRNVRSAANTDCYTLKGDPEGETFMPSFTSHGFRYVEITGNGVLLADNACIERIEGLVLCNTPDLIGDFSCSDELVNKLQSNIQWGQRGNSLLVFTDCPQRNERMGWTGDAQVFAATAAFNMDIRAFMHKWLLDVRDGQQMYNKQGAVPDTAPLGGDNRPDGCAGWADAAVIVPWELYLAYGDVSVLEENYDCMKKWIAYQSLPERQNFGLRTVNGTPLPEESDLASIPFIQVQQRRGDHLTFDPSTPFIFSATAYAAHVADLMAKIASILGKADDAAAFRTRFEQIRRAFREAWVQKDGSLAYWGEMSKQEPASDMDSAPICHTRYSNEPGNPHHPSQTAYALAIDFDLMPQETITRTAECFAQAIADADNHLSVGFLGISHLLPALSKVGRDDLAFRLLEQKGNPGWLYSVINGATTIWERWNSYIAESGTFGDVSMNSFNHYSYGAIGQWLYETVLGIRSGEQPDEAGYRRFRLSPTWGGTLTWAKGRHHSPFGAIASGWEFDGSTVFYRCSVPASTKATLTLPAADGPDSVRVTTENGAASRQNGPANTAVFELEPGSYEFQIG